MKTERNIKWLTRIGWIFFALSVVSFLGLLDQTENEQEIYEALKYGFISELFSLPDIKTIVLAGISAGVGKAVINLCKKHGLNSKKGKKLMASAIACITLSFTPLSMVSMLPSAYRMLNDEFYIADGYKDVDPQLYEIHAFLGSGESKAEDVDMWDYLWHDYDGHARDVYDTYKVCGWLKNISDASSWKSPQIEVVLVDQNGDDLLIDGQPAVLLGSLGYLSMDSIRSFETEAVSAGELSGQPVNFRVLRVQEGIFLDFFDEVEKKSVLELLLRSFRLGQEEQGFAGAS